MEFGEGITKNNTIFRAQGEDLIITFKDNEGSIRIAKGLTGGGYEVGRYKFSDGTITINEVKTTYLAPLEGTEGNDVITGSVVAEKAYGYGGNDSINVSDSTTFAVSDSDINKIIQDMTSYKIAEDTMINYSDNIEQEKELMNLVNSSM